MKAINSSKNSRGLFCQLYDTELNKYVMKMADKYFQRNQEARSNPRIAAVIHGDQLDETCSKYVWMVDYMPSKMIEKCRSNIVTPLDKRSFDNLLAGLKKEAVPGI
jgi:hypothetical protein